VPWNAVHFPTSMKYLSPLVREKAIEIANALLEGGMDEGKAIRVAIAKAKEWARNRLAERNEVAPLGTEKLKGLLDTYPFGL
jgi:uncharacterized protein YdaT